MASGHRRAYVAVRSLACARLLVLSAGIQDLPAWTDAYEFEGPFAWFGVRSGSHLRRPGRRAGAARTGFVPRHLDMAVSKADALRGQAVERARQGAAVHRRPYARGGVRIQRTVGR